MPYANLDDTTWSDPVLCALSDRAFRLHISAFSYCSNHRTDGKLTERQVEQVGFMFGLVGDPLKATVAELVQAEVWTQDLMAYTLVHFLKSNLTRARLDELREDAAARKRKSRSRHRNG